MRSLPLKREGWGGDQIRCGLLLLSVGSVRHDRRPWLIRGSALCQSGAVAAGQQGGDPAGRFVLFANRQDGDRDRNADESSRKPPQEAKEEYRKQHHEG